MRISIYGLVLTLLWAGCRPDPVEPNKCGPLEQALTTEQRVFLDLCFGSEFGPTFERVRKWQDKVRIFVPVPDSLLEAELDQVVAELNALSSGLQLERVADIASSNLLVYFGDKQTYVEAYQPAAQGLITSNFGLFSATWNNQTYLISRGTVCVDRVREPDPICQRHLLREELTQVLGMMNDTEEYPKSIFFAEYTCDTTYSTLDREFLSNFLSLDIEAGMCPDEVAAALF